MNRRAVLLSLLSGSRLFSAGPWKSKKASQWSEDDVRKLMSKSPWAKEISVSMGVPGGGMGGMGGGGRRGGGGMGGGGMSPSGGMGGAGGGMGGAEMGGAGSTAGGMGGSGNMGGMGGGGGAPPPIRALIRWESAAPMFEAVKAKRSPQAESHYIVTVTGLPMMGGRAMNAARQGESKEGAAAPEDRQKAMLLRMKDSTRLERKGKDPIPADRIITGRSQQGMVIGFLFSRQGQEITLADKEVTFHSRYGPMELKAKFSLPEMVYGGRLEL